MNVNTHALVISMATNGYDLAIENIIAITGCNLFELKEALPAIKAYMFKCPKPEFLGLLELTKEIWRL
jgi:hypothetical protein